MRFYQKGCKRFIAMLLTVMMIVGLLPYGATAYAKEDATKVATSAEYDYIADLLKNDNSISFDPATQTYLVVDVDAVQTEHMKSLNIYQAEENIKDYDYQIDVSINGTPVGKDATYYLASKADNTIETETVTGKSFVMNANSGKVAVFIVDKNATYEASYTVDNDRYYTKETWQDESGKTYNGDKFISRPTNGEIVTKYSGTAGDDAIVAPFSFQWDLCNWLDIEIWMPDVANKTMDNPGWVFPEGTTGYINFKVELRDEAGNISLLPKTYYNNYGDDDYFKYMKEDGIVSIPLSHYVEDAEDEVPYGEFDIYIPFGYDYRITLDSYSIDTLGGYAYCYDQEHTPQADGFCVTDHSLERPGPYINEWGSFMEFTFMPLNKEIRIEKQVKGKEPENAAYTFEATESVPTFTDGKNGDGYVKTDDVAQLLCNYPYAVYDAKTNQRVDDGSLKTDKNGHLSLKEGQYALFKVWGLPEDFADYEAGGFEITDIYKHLKGDVKKESVYTVNEVKSPECDTTITHKHDGEEKQVTGKKVEGVYGGDELLYRNVFKDSGETPEPTPEPTPTPHPGNHKVTLHYESNGGTTFADETYKKGVVVQLDKRPTREGYRFTGWYADKELTEKITDVKMTTNKTVYAGWVATTVPDMLNGDDHQLYIVGYPDGLVRPLGPVYRSEVAAIFYRLLKPEIRKANEAHVSGFSDVSTDAWYGVPVATLEKMGIISGRTKTTFDPNGELTRAEFAVICARFDTGKTDGYSNFTDIAGHWAEKDIERAAALGWVQGTPDGRFLPDEKITRAEAMTLINRVLCRIPESESDLMKDMIVWPDNTLDKWYYLPVQEATNSHTWKAKDDAHETWTGKAEDPDWYVKKK